MTQSKKPNPFVFRAGETDLGRHVPTCFDRPTPVTEEVDQDPRRSGTGNRVAAATKADVRRSAAKPRTEPARPEQDDVLLVLATLRSPNDEIVISRRCYRLCLAVAAKLGDCAADGKECLPVHLSNELLRSLEQSPVIPRADADVAAWEALIKLLSKGEGLKIVRSINSRDGHLSVGR